MVLFIIKFNFKSHQSLKFDLLSFEELTLLDEKEGVPSGIYLEAESEEARNAVLHALNSQVELAKARSGLKEAGLERMTKSLIFSRLVECAQVDECPVEEMTQMLEGTYW